MKLRIWWCLYNSVWCVTSLSAKATSGNGVCRMTYTSVVADHSYVFQIHVC